MVEANWKVVVENYLECYHCPVAHPSFADLIDLNTYTIETFGRTSTQIGQPKDADAAADAAMKVKYGRYNYIWPTFMLNIYPGPGNVSTNLIVPLGVDRTLAVYDFFYEEGAERGAAEEITGLVHQVWSRTSACVSPCSAAWLGTFDAGRLMLRYEHSIKHFQSLVARRWPWHEPSPAPGSSSCSARAAGSSSPAPSASRCCGARSRPARRCGSRRSSFRRRLRSTAREALRLLAFEGLVEPSLDRGATVRRLSPADIADIYRVRRHVETAAADAARPHAGSATRLAGALEELERAAAAREWAPLVEADLAFHRALVALLGSERLDRLQRGLELELRLAFSITAFVEREFDDPDPIVADHRLILERLLAGDAAASGRGSWTTSTATSRRCDPRLRGPRWLSRCAARWRSSPAAAGGSAGRSSSASRATARPSWTPAARRRRAGTIAWCRSPRTSRSRATCGA